jgi:uncharacterized protein YegL
MPLLGDNDQLETHAIKGSNYGFSATRVEDLGASEYTLVGIAVDASSSVSSFESEINKTIQEIVKACRHSPRADNLMMRLLAFSSDLSELHGFKPLTECNVDDYRSAVHPSGMTALYDACCNLGQSITQYGKSLSENDFSVNAILFVVTDGMDNRSTFTPHSVAQTLKDAVKSESLESIVSILVGVNIQDPSVSQYLKSFEKEAGFTQYVELANADAKTLAKLAEFVSKSISAQSQALGTGGPSQSLSF